MLKLCVNPTAAVRLAEARRFVEGFLLTRILIVGATREAADDSRGLATAVRSGPRHHVRRSSAHTVSTGGAPGDAGARRATLDAGDRSGAAGGDHAAAHEAATLGELSYLHAIAGCPGFPRAALSTLSELRHALVGPEIVERSRHPEWICRGWPTGSRRIARTRASSIARR